MFRILVQGNPSTQRAQSIGFDAGVGRSEEWRPGSLEIVMGRSQASRVDE
jgi:hypothetical protein